MPLKFDRRKLRETRQTSWLLLDLIMVVLVLLNLGLIIFDTMYAAQPLQSALEATVPAFNAFYGERIHAHFIFYDLVFVSIFLAEFCIQWMVAVRRRIYPRWYFFPFLRWYDLVGCIPIGSLRMLRLLRVVSLLVRLQKMGVIDLTDTRPYQFLEFYFNVFIDEVSDRVILRTLDDIRHEVEVENPITRQIFAEVIAPQRAALVQHLSRRIGMIAGQSYRTHQEAIRDYVELVISEAVSANEGIGKLERVPVLGRTMVDTLRQSINDIVYEVFDRTIRDLSSTEDNRLVDEGVTAMIDAILGDHAELGEIGTQVTIEAIELIKERVRVQHWKESLRRRQVETARMS